MTLSIILILIFFALVLVALNGFFVAAEFAIVKVRRTRLEELAGQGVRAARISILCVEQLDEYLSATQLGITLVSLGLGWIGESAFAHLFIRFFPDTVLISKALQHGIATGLAFFLVTMLHVVLGELVPKSMAIQNAEKITLAIAQPLAVFYKVARPLIHAFTLIANMILKALGYHGFEEPPLSENELKLVMKESREDGIITESEAQIINRAFEFSDRRAADIMVHAPDVDYISLSRPLDQNLVVIKKNMHTRFPVCRAGLETVFGIVHMKDVWPILLTNFSNEAFLKCARPALFVDIGMRQDQILKIFQVKRGHLAMVQDAKKKNVVGMVTMEDVLEHLVGEITDEHGN